MGHLVYFPSPFFFFQLFDNGCSKETWTLIALHEIPGLTRDLQEKGVRDVGLTTSLREILRENATIALFEVPGFGHVNRARAVRYPPCIAPHGRKLFRNVFNVGES